MFDQNEKTAKPLGVASLIMSLLGLCCLAEVIFVQLSGLWFSVGCVAFSVTACVLGAVSRKQKRENNPAALSGLIISIITLALFIILWVLIITLFFFFSNVIHAFSGLGQIG